MNNIEITEVLKIAEDFWPKTSPAELGLLRKIVGPMSFYGAKEVLERARIDSKYMTLPIKEISKHVKVWKSKPIGEQITCCALERETGKSYECVVLAQSSEGAKVGMAKYLTRYNLDPTDFIIYVGEENFDSFFFERHRIRCELNPAIKTTTERLRKKQFAGLRQTVDAVVSSMAPEFGAFNDDDIPF